MKRSIVLALIMFLLAGGASWAAQKKEAPAKADRRAGCTSCHASYEDLLGKKHPSVKGSTIAACLGCHRPNTVGDPKPAPFSARIHKAHESGKTPLDCTACHTWTPGKPFGLPGQKVTYGKPTKEIMEGARQAFASWSASSFTDGLHRKANVTCAGCHGLVLPEKGDSVENERCLACHGPMEKLETKSEPKDFADRNPHKSHLGPINCTVCHKAHSSSTTYCLQCHGKFKMPIPGQ